MFLLRALLTDRKKYQFVKFKKAIQEQYLIRFIIFFLELANLKLKTYSIVFTWVLHHPRPEVEEMVLHRRRRPSSIRLGSGGDWCRTRTRSPGRRDCRTGPSVWRKKKTCFNSIFSYIEYSCDGKSVIMKLKCKNNEGWQYIIERLRFRHEEKYNENHRMDLFILCFINQKNK